MEESFCLPPRAQASVRACASYSEEPPLLASGRIQVDTLICRPNQRRLKTLIALSSLPLVVAFIGCSSSFQLTPAASVQFRASTDTVEFGTVTVGQEADSSVTLVNRGPAAIQISDLNVTGTGFTVTSPGNLPISVAANGGTYVVSLHFKPKATGDATGKLTISNTSLASPSLKIKLHGEGSAPSGPGSPALSSFSCGQSSITGSASDTCTVTLNAAAGSSGLAVSLASNNSAVSIPASVTVPAGAISAGFTAAITAVTTVQNATLTASAGGVSKTVALQLNASVPTLSLNAANISFGNVAVNTAAAQTVTLSSTGTIAVTVNSATLTGAGFSISGMTFPVTLKPSQSAKLTVQFDPTVSGTASGQIKISSNSSTNSTATVSLSGTGVVAAPSALSCTSSSLTGAGTDACTVTLNSAAPSGGTSVSLSSNNSAVTVPASVTVPANATSAGFSATVSAVSTAQTTTLTATAGSVSKTFAIQLNASVPTLSAFSCANSSMTGAGTDACTVTLSRAAPRGGLTVSLSSNNTDVVVPASVTVPARATSAGFSATVSAVGSTQTATLTAAEGGVSKSFALQLNASQPTLSAFSCANSSMTGAGTDACTVTLSGAAPSGGLTVSLSSNNTDVDGPRFRDRPRPRHKRRFLGYRLGGWFDSNSHPHRG